MTCKFSKAQFPGYFILMSRFLLGSTFISYGIGKLIDEQFGISEAELATPLNDLSLFKVSWYLFDQQPFKAYIGISQIICGLLLIYHRTQLIGAFMFLPIVTTILFIDLTFMPGLIAEGFAWRLGFYIVLDLGIIWYHKKRMKQILEAIWTQAAVRLRYPVWTYLLLPICAILLEMIGVLPRIIALLILHPSKTFDDLIQLNDLVSGLLKQLIQ